MLDSYSVYGEGFGSNSEFFLVSGLHLFVIFKRDLGLVSRRSLISL